VLVRYSSLTSERASESGGRAWSSSRASWRSRYRPPKTESVCTADSNQVRRTTARSANASTRYNLRPFDFEITCVRASRAFRSPLCARRLGTIRARRRLPSLALADRTASAAFVAIIRAFLLTILLAASLPPEPSRVSVGAHSSRRPEGACDYRDARAVAGARDGTPTGRTRSPAPM